MRANHSPWVYQLDTNRPIKKIHTDTTTDVVIVGGGIAGISTAFFALKYTNKKVVLCDRFRVGHGATGHNAGQIVSYFERPFQDLVREFGLEKAARSQHAIESAWTLLDEMYNDAGLSIPLARFDGHVGVQTKEQLISFLEDLRLRREAGLPQEVLRIAFEITDIMEVELAPYVGLYTLVPHKNILELLETHNELFIACLSYQKGVMNSALFVQCVVMYLERVYAERFTLFEDTMIQKVLVHDTGVTLDATLATIQARHVILCTNGFEHFSLITEQGLDLNVRFHAHVWSRVGYMSAYLDRFTKPPTAISYLNTDVPSTDQTYFYVTRRPFEYDGNAAYNLICIGGGDPDRILNEKERYSHTDEYPEEAIRSINTFLHTTIDEGEQIAREYIFTWHGLMGYTKNFVRMIGLDPEYASVGYNLGCNGIGILPSIYGGKRIAQLLAGDTVEPTIFDITL